MKSFIWMGAIVVVLIGVMYFGVRGSGEKPAFDFGKIEQADNVKGNRDSKVVVMEYSDFQCPACRTYYFVMKELAVEFGDRVAFVYRHFPLVEIHPNSARAAEAAEAAGKQGKFWEMHDLLFEKQGEWTGASRPEPMFESYASLLGLSPEQFKADMALKEVGETVRKQRDDAIEAGLQGTPSFFINGKQIQNPSSVEAFRAIINDTLAGRQ